MWKCPGNWIEIWSGSAEGEIRLQLGEIQQDNGILGNEVFFHSAL